MKALERGMKGLPKNFIIGIITSNGNYDDVNIKLLKILNKKKPKGIYVCINKPYSHLSPLLESKGIDMSKMHFIDCITKSAGIHAPKSDNCIFVNSPGHLTDLNLELNNLLHLPSKEERFVYLDSLSTLRMHNTSEQVFRFMHYLTGKMRVFGLSGLMLSIEDKEEKGKSLASKLSQLYDK